MDSSFLSPPPTPVFPSPVSPLLLPRISIGVEPRASDMLSKHANTDLRLEPWNLHFNELPVDGSNVGTGLAFLGSSGDSRPLLVHEVALLHCNSRAMQCQGLFSKQHTTGKATELQAEQVSRYPERRAGTGTPHPKGGLAFAILHNGSPSSVSSCIHAIRPLLYPQGVPHFQSHSFILAAVLISLVI